MTAPSAIRSVIEREPASRHRRNINVRLAVIMAAAAADSHHRRKQSDRSQWQRKINGSCYSHEPV